MRIKHFLFSLVIIIMALASCKPEEQPPVISYVFSDVSVDAKQTSATITCRNESVDDDKVYANVLLSKNENVTDAAKYPLHLQNDTLRGTINGLERNTMYFFCFEVSTANEHKRTDEVHHFETTGGGANVTVTTSEAINVAQTTVTGGGNVSAEGNFTVSMRGVCWDIVHSPNVVQSPHLLSGEGMGSFMVNVTGLSPETTYYMRAYAVCNDVTYYGNEVSFTTLSGQAPSGQMPSVTTGEVTDITQTSAKCSGNVTADGGSAVTERGICWSISHNPTAIDSHATSGSGTGFYTVNITGLVANTTYYVRAYAMNGVGIAYGDEKAFTTLPGATVPEGAVNGVFSVSATKKVRFSKGNLQYIGSTTPAYWKFAENQWDYLGTSTGQDSGTTTVDRDLFGWATSGYYCGSSCYMPFDINNSYSATYGPSYSNLTGEYANADWGVYNAIDNGGNAPGMWRTLSSDEWTYVMAQRDTPSKILFAKAVVNGVNGVVLLPDDWVGTNFTLAFINNKTAHYDSNVISENDWNNVLEPKGAVFLPAAGTRSGATVSYSGSNGMYWSSSVRYSDTSCAISFTDTSMGQEAMILGAYAERKKYFGGCVRLVQECR